MVLWHFPTGPLQVELTIFEAASYKIDSVLYFYIMRSDSPYSSTHSSTRSPMPPYPSDGYNGVPKRNRYRWVQLLLIIGFSLFALISMVALTALWWFFGLAPSTMTDVTPKIQVEKIRPELALMYLAGDPVDALALQALQAGEYDTSRALISFGANAMPDPPLALTLQLSQRFQNANDTTMATYLLHDSAAIAVLDTALTPLERAETLLLCADNFLQLGKITEAVDAAQQVLRIAELTPDLLPAVRGRLLQDLQGIVNQLPDDELRQRTRELARNPYLAPSGLVVQEPTPYADGSIEFEQQLADHIRLRQQLARQVAERMVQAPVADVSPLILSLAQALQAEDEQRTLYFNQFSTSESLTFSLQFWLVNEHRQWQILKLAVARGVFGLSLVPEWEAAEAAITNDLAEITDILQTKYLVLAQAEGEPLVQLTQRIAILRWFALQNALGLYPQRSDAINESLLIAQNELIQFNTSAALKVSYQSDATPPGFRIEAHH